jgi:hypothetical protein
MDVYHLEQIREITLREVKLIYALVVMILYVRSKKTQKSLAFCGGFENISVKK